MSPRQEQILRTIVETYSATAEPVSSQFLSERFNVSSATVRNDMAVLERGDYITHQHTSAGRIPTERAYRWYVNHLNQDQTTPQAGHAAQAIERRIRDIDVAEEAIKEATESLSKVTGNLAVATLPGQVYRYGLSNLMSQPEFMSFQRLHEMARIVDYLDDWMGDLELTSPIDVLIGRDNPLGKLSNTSAIIAQFRSPFSEQSYIGLIGPVRQNYPYVMHLVEHVGRALEEAINE